MKRRKNAVFPPKQLVSRETLGSAPCQPPHNQANACGMAPAKHLPFSLPSDRSPATRHGAGGEHTLTVYRPSPTPREGLGFPLFYFTYPAAAITKAIGVAFRRVRPFDAFPPPLCSPICAILAHMTPRSLAPYRQEGGSFHVKRCGALAPPAFLLCGCHERIRCLAVLFIKKRAKRKKKRLFHVKQPAFGANSERRACSSTV